MRLFFALSILICSEMALAQDTLKRKGIDSAALRDVRDLFFKKHNKATEIVESAFNFSIVPAAGYSLQTGWAGVLSANVGVRLGKKKDAPVSSINTSLTYSQYRQTIIPLIGNVWSKNGKWNYSLDWRYMKYPSKTWGLAGHDDPNDGYTVNFTYLKLHQMVLRSVGKHLYIGTGFFYDWFGNVTELDANGNPLSPEAVTNLRSEGLSGNDEHAASFPIRLLYDSRLNQVNPHQGWYISATWRDNLKIFGSRRNWQSFVIDIRKYIQVSPKGGTLAFWGYSWSSSTKTPYLLLPSIGWDDMFNTGRGYIQGRFRSNIMNYLEAEYRFNILRSGLLGGVVFANVQSYKTKPWSGPIAVAPAAGAGIRFKLNKKSGANLCVDYGIGQDGSRGFFVNLGEVF